MEVKKAENNKIKEIVPIKGDLLAKLRNKLQQKNSKQKKCFSQNENI